MLDSTTFRKRVVALAFLSPLAAVPAALGLASLGLGVILGEPAGFFGFLGVSGMLLGAGVGLTRLTLFTDELAAKVMSEDLQAAKGVEETRQKSLERRLALDVDPRLRQFAELLRRLSRRIEAADALPGAAHPHLLPEITSNLRRLHETCMASLERAEALGRAGQEMATDDGRRRIQDRREELLEELGHGVHQLAAAVDQLHATSLEKDAPSAELARLCEELDEGLKVAQRLDERMESLERSLRGTEPREYDGH